MGGAKLGPTHHPAIREHARLWQRAHRARLNRARGARLVLSVPRAQRAFAPCRRSVPTNSATATKLGNTANIQMNIPSCIASHVPGSNTANELRFLDGGVSPRPQPWLVGHTLGAARVATASLNAAAAASLSAARAGAARRAPPRLRSRCAAPNRRSGSARTLRARRSPLLRSRGRLRVRSRARSVIRATTLR